jgi:hypothetical protein
MRRCVCLVLSSYPILSLARLPFPFPPLPNFRASLDADAMLTRLYNTGPLLDRLEPNASTN